MNSFHGTTILSVRTETGLAMGGDGQVTLGDEIMKANTVKVRALFGEKVLAGFAGSTADAFTLFEKFENFLDKNDGKLARAAVELAKEWRTDRALRRLEAMMIVADKDETLLLSGSGDVIEPGENAIAIGSGAGYARSAANALINKTQLSAVEIVEKSMKIAASICIYTNENFTIKTLA